MTPSQWRGMTRADSGLMTHFVVWDLGSMSFFFFVFLYNSVIIDVIRLSFFNSQQGIRYQMIKKCVSTLDGNNEPELPMGLVALACTGVCQASIFVCSYGIWAISCCADICSSRRMEDWLKSHLKVRRQCAVVIKSPSVICDLPDEVLVSSNYYIRKFWWQFVRKFSIFRPFFDIFGGFCCDLCDLSSNWEGLWPVTDELI